MLCRNGTMQHYTPFGFLFSYFTDKSVNQMREGTMTSLCCVFVWLDCMGVKRPT